jgi:hypothetical protein
MPTTMKSALSAVARARETAIEHVLTPAGRRFARIAITAVWGIPVIMGPLLGSKRLEGFSPLLDVLSKDLRRVVLPVSILFVALVAVALEFYFREKVAQRTFAWLFPLLVIAFLAAVAAVIYLDTFRVLRVSWDADGGSKLVITTPSRGSDCDCQGLGDLACARAVTLDDEALETCWGGAQLKVVKLEMIASYLLTTSLFALLIAVTVLKLTNLDRTAATSRQRRRRREGSVPRAGRRGSRD